MPDAYHISPEEQSDINSLGGSDALLEERDHYKALAERLGTVLAEIRGSLDQVAVYEGMDGSPVALLVAELVRDHEELEARIDAALMRIASGPSYALGNEVAAILRGGPRVPDDPREITGG